MFDAVFILLFAAVPIVVLYLLKLSGINYRTVNIPSIFTGYYFVFAYLGILPLYYYWDEYRYLVGVTDRNIIILMFLYSSLSLLLIALSFLFLSKVIGMRVYHNSGVKYPLTNLTVFSVISVVAVCCCVLLIYLSKVPGIPLFEVFTGDDFAKKHLRSEATNNFTGHYYRYGLFFNSLLPFTTYILYSNALVSNRRMPKLLFLIILPITVFSTVMLTEKAPLVWLIMGMLFTHFYTKGKAIKNKQIFIMIGFGLVLLIFMYMYFFGLKGRPFKVIIQSIASRTFTGQISPAYFYLKYFPDLEPFLLGRSFPNPRGIFPFQHFRITVEIMNYMNPSLAGTGIVGSAPTVYWAEIYANFGYIAPFLFAFIVGFVLYLMHVLTSKLYPSPIKVALISWLSIHLMKLAGTGISGYIMDIDLLAIIVVGLMLIVIEGKGKIRYISKQV